MIAGTSKSEKERAKKRDEDRNERQSGAMEDTTAQTLAATGPILRGLLAFPRVLRLYPTGHGRVEAALKDLRDLFDELFAHHLEPLQLSVIGANILVDGVPMPDMPETTARLAFLLRRHRIRGLRVSPGLTRREIRLIGEILGRDHKDILRGGGIEHFLGGGDQPHIEVIVYQFSLGSGDGKGGFNDGPGAVLPTQILDAIESAVTDTNTAERLETIRDAFIERVLKAGNAAESGVEVFDALLTNFFSRPEWARLEPDRVRDAIRTFLDLLEKAARSNAADGVRGVGALRIGGDESDEGSVPIEGNHLESIERLFRNLTPKDLLEPDEQEDEEEANQPSEAMRRITEDAVAYEAIDLIGDLVETLGGMENLTASFRREMETYPVEENTLLVLGDLMVTATEEAQYQVRRSSFMEALRGDGFSAGSVATVRCHLARDLPAIEFEDRENLLDAVFEDAADGVALTQYLESMADRPDAVRRILRRIRESEDCFVVLAKVLCTPRLAAFHGVVGQSLVSAAKQRPETFCQWALADRRTFFRSEVFETFFQRCYTILGPICKTILTEGTDLERSRLIQRLTRDGSDNALRLLVLGVNYGREPENTDVINGLSEFKQPLAVAVLRSVIHCSNTKSVRREEVSAAIDSLHGIGTDEAWSVLWEIVQKRVLLLPLFRRELRKMAEEKLVLGERP